MRTKKFRVVELRPWQLAEQIAYELSELGIQSTFFPKRYESFSKLYVLADENYQLCEGPTEFLAYCVQRSRSADADTVRSYAESLASWLDYTSFHGIEEDSIRETHVQDYRNQLARKHSKDSGLSPATITLRVGTVLRYLEWRSRFQQFHTPLGAQLATRKPTASNYRMVGVDTPQSPLITLPKVASNLPSQLSPAMLNEINNKLKSPYNLMFRWALSTGMRRCEICRLTTRDIEHALATNFESNIAAIQILRKGGKVQSIFVLKNLLEETAWYITAERPRIEIGCVDFVFLNKSGRPVSRQSLTKAYKDACSIIGIKSHFHMLRHTFAINVLQILEQRASEGAAINPLKVLQTMMGHASIETTDIYLRAIQVASPSVEYALGFLYGHVSENA